MQVGLLRPEQDAAELFQAVEEVVGGNPSLIAFRDMDGDTVLLHLLSEYQQGKEEVERLHEQLLLSLTGGPPMRLSVGTVEETEEAAAQSYAHAKMTQEYFMLFPERNLLHYEEVQDRHEVAVQGMPLNWEDDLKLIMAKDKEALLVRIQDHFEQLRRMEGITPVLLQGIAMEWLIRFKMQLQEIRHVEEPELFADGFASFAPQFP